MVHLANSKNIEAKQLNLPIAEINTPALDNGASFKDPAFAGNKGLPIHRWVPWIAGFSSDFVRDALQRYTNGKATVLDPFAGVGTTLVEAILCGHNACGFEINPYATLASRVKVNAYQTNVEMLYDYTLQFKQFYDGNIDSAYIVKSCPPPGFKTRSAFYNPKVLRKVLILQDFINTIENVRIGHLFKLAFASTMVTYSNYSYEPSLGRRVSAGKNEIVDYPVGEAILSKLSQMREDIKWFQAHMPNGKVNATIINDSFFKCSDHLAPESVDVVVTSPPYLNNYHYNRNTRPHLYWLGYAKISHSDFA